MNAVSLLGFHFLDFYFLLSSAEQKVKAPSLHCDARVQTVCADVMNLVKDQVRALSPQVISFSCLDALNSMRLHSLCLYPIFNY